MEGATRRVPRPSVNIPSRIVRALIRDALPGVVITPALACSLRAALESIASEWIATASMCAKGLTLRPRHLQLALATDASLARTFVGIVPGVGASVGSNVLAFSTLPT